MTGLQDLVPDYGLHGGGVHMHSSGDYLNAHLDYDIHPKMSMQRKLNIIIYMQPDWKDEWGGNLGLWTHDSETNQPKELVKSIVPKFNRAVIFDTTQNSWHGVTEGIFTPPGIYRRSLAAYYLIPAQTGYNVEHARKKALFVPRIEQQGNKEVEQFCKTRSGI
jgi:Rps23 Pro-64 3,4-dihydroxylase Tpa1-like proline 4-hydroxylase